MFFRAGLFHTQNFKKLIISNTPSVDQDNGNNYCHPYRKNFDAAAARITKKKFPIYWTVELTHPKFSVVTVNFRLSGNRHPESEKEKTKRNQWQTASLSLSFWPQYVVRQFYIPVCCGRFENREFFIMRLDRARRDKLQIRDKRVRWLETILGLRARA